MAEVQSNSDHAADVTTIKQTTAIDTTQRVYLGDEKYHATLGCLRGVGEPATIATAIEQDLRPCGRCQPPDYRSHGKTSTADEGTATHSDHGRNHSQRWHVRANDITIPLPDIRPSRVKDLDPIIHAKSECRSRAHIAARGGEQPKPLCVVVGTYGNTGTWLLTSQVAYPEPDEWFEICTRCLVAYDRVDGEVNE